MPKLNAKTARAVAQAASEDTESGNLQPLPAGTYPARLAEVVTKEGPKGPYWTWRYEVLDPIPGHFSSQFVNTSLSPAAAWKLAEQFTAHDADPATDTEELIGDVVNLVVVTKVIESGNKAGELGNEVTKTLPCDDVDSDEEPF
jgi:hypothetical protein